MIPPRARPIIKWTALAVVLAVGAVVVVRSGGSLVKHIHQVSFGLILLALCAVLAGLLANFLTWRAILTDLGSPLPFRPALSVFFVAQLGKYVPGSVWPLLAQMELGKQHSVPRSRSGAVGLLTVAISLEAGLLMAAVTLPFARPDALAHYWYAFLTLPVLALGLVPRVANPVLDKLLRLARRGGLEKGLSARGMSTAFCWAFLAWGMFGVQVWILLSALTRPGAAIHGGQALLLAVGTFALAWTIGYVIVIAPAGAGVREAALVLGLAPVLDRDSALLVALLSRALMTLGDCAWALLATVVGRKRLRVGRQTQVGR